MSDEKRQRTSYYFLAQAVGELRVEIEKLKRARDRDRDEISTLIKHNRSLRSTITRLEKRLIQGPGKTARRQPPPAQTEPRPQPPSEPNPGFSGVPDFSEPISDLNGRH